MFLGTYTFNNDMIIFNTLFIIYQRANPTLNTAVASILEYINATLWKCNFPLNPYARRLDGCSVCVIIFPKREEKTHFQNSLSLEHSLLTSLLFLGLLTVPSGVTLTTGGPSARIPPTRIDSGGEWYLHDRELISFRVRYRVLIKYCVISKILK